MRFNESMIESAIAHTAVASPARDDAPPQATISEMAGNSPAMLERQSDIQTS